MKTNPFQVKIILLAAISLAACGPLSEQTTASIWTPTPPPTFTPTLAPIDLTVTVVDESGAPVAGASITYPESGNDKSVQSDEQGKFSWTNLAGESATFKVSVQGYLFAEKTVTLQHGANEIKIALKRDPFGLIPSEVCAAGEGLLYVEDFQDNRAQGWDEIDLKKPGWNMAPSAEAAGNIILSAQYTDMLGNKALFSRMEGMDFDNAVWRVRFLISKPFATRENWFAFNWKFAPKPFDLNGEQIFDSRYQLPLTTNFIELRRLQQPVSNIGIGEVKGPKDGKWHLLEISTFLDITEVWLDGQRLMAYRDPQPLPPGTMGLELRLKESDSIVYFDDLSVCGLSVPFASIAPAAP